MAYTLGWVAADWTIDSTTGNIRYIGDAHGGTSPSYVRVIDLHRALQDFADQQAASGDDIIDISSLTPSARSTDNIITLLNNFNLDATAIEHIYDGSIIQNGGDDIWDGVVNFGNVTYIILHQNGAILNDTTNFWNSYSADGTADFKFPPNNTQAGVSHNFLVKVREAGSDIDQRYLLGLSREFGNTYAEFQIQGTSRGNNVLALSESNDLNNETSAGTVATWDQFANDSEGWDNSQDVDGIGGVEEYYSRWDIGGATTPASPTINDLYEYTKYVARRGTASTLYGLDGDLFRGITHQVTYTGLTGTIDESNPVTFGGGATAQVLADDGTDTMWVQLLTGTTANMTGSITQSAPDAASATTNVVTARAVSPTFLGQSTGSAIIGAYGVGIDAGDLTASDTLTDLQANTINPPNNVSFSVSGLESGEDRVLVGPRGNVFQYDNEAVAAFTVGETLTFGNGATAVVAEVLDQGTSGRLIVGPITGTPPPDNNSITGGSSGATANVNGAVAATINTRMLTLATDLTTGTETSVVVNEAIPTDIPSSGTLRVINDSGFHVYLTYSSYTGSTFTISSYAFNGTDENDAATTAGGVAGVDPNVYVTWIDKLAASATESVTVVYSADRPLFVRVRDGDVTPIQTFETPATLSSGGGSVAAIRTADA